MLKFAELIDENVEELAALDAMDGGKLYKMGKTVEIPGAADTIRYFAGAADKIHGSTLKMSRELHGYTLREPIGVVGHIIPWNFPSQMFTMKVGPALAAGWIQDGVLNVVTGYGHTAGAAISSHMDIDKGEVCVDWFSFLLTRNQKILSFIEHGRGRCHFVSWWTTDIYCKGEIFGPSNNVVMKFKDMGMESLDKYLQVKSVAMPIHDSPCCKFHCGKHLPSFSAGPYFNLCKHKDIENHDLKEITKLDLDQLTRSVEILRKHSRFKMEGIQKRKLTESGRDPSKTG
ncbi:Aldehyde dehydrogenase family 2 member C4 [Sesamum angolense]|uniref:Aldehyde dehydrogenase family 2 member C4 n=1 Tax=Sesamum angolense TaxID=2727404 RepID=A0AAE1WE33_9LAMI|nr:Aldehyde dehydrogenase family 2 member C4 [Sesamum angolense]